MAGCRFARHGDKKLNSRSRVPARHQKLCELCVVSVFSVLNIRVFFMSFVVKNPLPRSRENPFPRIAVPARH